MHTLAKGPTHTGETQSDSGSLTAKQAALLQLAPGVLSLPFFALVASVLAAKGIPNIFALSLTILLVEVPVAWAIIVRYTRRESAGRFSFAQAFPWRASIPWWQYLLVGLPVILFSMFVIVGIGPRIEAGLLSNVFDWVPAWFVLRPDPTLFAGMSRGVLIAFLTFMFISMIVVGGFTQELFARGFLLPRTAHMGTKAPVFNALMFAIFHMIAPWSWATFFIMTLPWAYLVWWKRSVKIGIFIHVGMLALQWLAMTLFALGVIAPPA